MRSITENFNGVKKKSVVSNQMEPIVKLKTAIKDMFTFETEIAMIAAIYMIVLHVVGFVWAYYFAFPAKWQTLAFAVFMFYFAGYGISIGAHRYWSHRSFKATTPLKILLIIMHCAAGQNTIFEWVRDHRVHHKCSDTPADPHNVNRGFFFAHIGWLMLKKRPEVIQRGKEINIDDILNDPLVQFQEKHFTKLKLLFCFILPTVAGVVLWGESWCCAIAWECFIRYILTSHATFTINSFAHTFGYRPYNKDICPSESWFTDLATLGDGHHNFHHTFPYDCFSSEYFDYLHLSTYVIKLWALLGLAYDLRVATPETIKAYSKRMGDGTHGTGDFHGNLHLHESVHEDMKSG